MIFGHLVDINQSSAQELSKLGVQPHETVKMFKSMDTGRTNFLRSPRWQFLPLFHPPLIYYCILPLSLVLSKFL